MTLALLTTLSLVMPSAHAVPSDAARADAENALAAFRYVDYYQHVARLSGHWLVDGVQIPDRFSKRGLNLTREYIKSVFRNAGYTKIHRDPFSTKNKYARRASNGVNYYVEIPGRSRPEEIVVVGAHYDSQMMKIKGANDNASGAAAVLALAELLQREGIQAERTLRFIVFDGEELGYMGSLEHFSQVALRGEQVELFINLDMIGYPLTGHEGFHFDAREYRPNLETLVHQAAALLPEDARMTPVQAPRLYRSDHSVGPKIGYPALGLAERVRDHRGRIQAISPNYHTTKDVISMLDMDYAFGVARYLTALAISAAHSQEHWARPDDPARQVTHCEQYLTTKRAGSRG